MSDAVEKLRQWIARQPMTGASGGGNHTGLDLFAKAVDEFAFRAERAEASLHVRTVEYDEMQRSQEAGAERIRELMAQVQRAEADNAALLDAMVCARGVLGYPHQDEDDAAEAHGILNANIAAEHPGTALLERMRALERHLRTLTSEGYTFRDVEAARDALKVPRE